MEDGTKMVAAFAAGMVAGPLGVIAALAVGGREWSRRQGYVHGVEDAVRSAVPGFTQTHLQPQVSFGEGTLGRWLGRVLPAGAFSFRVPSEVRSADVFGIEQCLRERLPTRQGTSWVFEWDLRRGTCSARVAPDLPKSVWHPYADGSFGNPLAPQGDPSCEMPFGTKGEQEA